VHQVGFSLHDQEFVSGKTVVHEVMVRYVLHASVHAAI